MARVKQVVDWCYATNLYVIINCHWDGGWLENNITDTVNPTINAKQELLLDTDREHLCQLR